MHDCDDINGCPWCRAIHEKQPNTQNTVSLDITAVASWGISWSCCWSLGVVEVSLHQSLGPNNAVPIRRFVLPIWICERSRWGRIERERKKARKGDREDFLKYWKWHRDDSLTAC